MKTFFKWNFKTFIFVFLFYDDVRWYTSHAIPRTPSFPFSIYTNWWKCVTTLEKWTTLSTTSSITNVCSLIKFKINYYYLKSNIKNVSSVVVSLFPHRSRVLGQTWPSKFALSILRGHEKGNKSNYFETRIGYEYIDPLRICQRKSRKWPHSSTRR